jgi:hypothetical protein
LNVKTTLPPLPELIYIMLTFLWMSLTDMEAKLQTLKAEVENMIAYFYPQDSNTAPRAAKLLDILPT